MMVKEHFIEAYGVPDFTIGWGPSAGTMQQLLIANAYLVTSSLPAGSPGTATW